MGFFGRKIRREARKRVHKAHRSYLKATGADNLMGTPTPCRRCPHHCK